LKLRRKSELLCVDKPHTDQLDFVVRARIRTVAQFEIANYKRFPATVRPEADKRKANCRCSGIQNFTLSSVWALLL